MSADDLIRRRDVLNLIAGEGLHLLDKGVRALPAVAAPGVTHASDCAVHNEPAYPAGPCDCDADTPAPALMAELVDAAKAFSVAYRTWSLIPSRYAHEKEAFEQMHLRRNALDAVLAKLDAKP